MFQNKMSQSYSLALCSVLIASIAACTNVPLNQAPVVERDARGLPVSAASSSTAAANPSAAVASGVASGASSAGSSLPRPGVSNTGTGAINNSVSNSVSNPVSNSGGITNNAIISPTLPNLPNLPSLSTTSNSTIPNNTNPSAARPAINRTDASMYVVKKGDTLYSIALENGLAYRDLADWNNIVNPSYIQIDQVLRMNPPSSNSAGSAAGAGATTSATTGAVAQSMPIAMGGTAAPTTVQANTATNNTSTTATQAVVATMPTNSSVAAANANATVPQWQWPTRNRPTEAYVEGKSKGLDIAGALGDPVWAVADGTVVYAGSNLKTYGQMLIIKHNEVYLSAYAHNSKLLVQENQTVKRGQKIAEIGNTESEGGRYMLHFQLRRSGKPVDPAKTLP